MRFTPAILLVGALVPALAFGGFNASSYKKPSSRSTASPYDAGAALDGDPTTAWVIDPEQTNAGQWIELDVPRGKIDKVSVVVGWNKDPESWDDYARLKAARIEIYNLDTDDGQPKMVAEKDVAFEDKRDAQTIDLADIAVGGEYNGGRVRLVVQDVYPGKDYEHLALGEVFARLIEFDATTRKLVESSSTADGSSADNLVDDSVKTVWSPAATDAKPSFTIDGGKFSVSSIGVLAGPKTGARPKKIEVSQGGNTRTYDVADLATAQFFDVPAVMGYNGSGVGSVTVSVLETYPGTVATAPLAIADVKFRATLLEAF